MSDLNIANKNNYPSAIILKQYRRVSTGLSKLMVTSNGAVGFFLLAFLVFFAIFAPLIAPFSPNELTDNSLASPSFTHFFGTDNLGQDVFSMVVYGSRSSLTVGITTALVSLFLGGTVGMLAGYYRGWVEVVLMRITELFQTLPAVIIVLFLVAMFGSHFWLLVVAVALAIWPLQARLVYGQFIKLRETDYVAAAVVAGMPTYHVILREILPNALQPIIVQVSLDASVAILIEAALGYLGISDPNVVSWGQMLFVSQDFLSTAWWMSIFPGFAICIAVVGLNMFADGLNEVADPKGNKTVRSFHD